MDPMESTEAFSEQPTKKEKRYKRPTFAKLTKAAERPRFTLTKNDIDILAAHDRHRVIDSEQIHRLFRRSKRNLLFRLHCLYQHGYILRPSAQKPTPATMSRGDGRPLQSVLSRKGKVVVSERRSLPGHAFDPLAARGSLEHERGATEIMVRLELGLPAERTIEW